MLSVSAESPPGDVKGLHILQISGLPPRLPQDGSSATFATVRAMCQAGHRIAYAYVAQHAVLDEFAIRLQRECLGRLKFIPLPLRAHWIDGFRRYASTGRMHARMLVMGFNAMLGGRARLERFGPLIGLLQGPERYAAGRVLRRAIVAERFDLAQVDYPWMLPMVDQLPESILRVFVAHEIASELLRQRGDGNTRLGRAVQDRETEWMRRYDAVITLSQDDAQLLADRLGKRSVECTQLALAGAYQGPIAPRSHRFSFLGGYDHLPNVDAVDALREIVPLLRAALGDCSVEIIGCYPQEFVRKHAALRFRGFVARLEEVLPGSIFLCPIRRGSGMRVKILDAVRCGAPVISTAVGVGGTNLEPERHYLQANEPGEFASQAVRIVTGKIDVLGMVRRAQECIKRQFGPEHVVSRRSSVLRALIARKHGLGR